MCCRIACSRRATFSRWKPSLWSQGGASQRRRRRNLMQLWRVLWARLAAGSQDPGQPKAARSMSLRRNFSRVHEGTGRSEEGGADIFMGKVCGDMPTTQHFTFRAMLPRAASKTVPCEPLANQLPLQWPSGPRCNSCDCRCHRVLHLECIMSPRVFCLSTSGGPVSAVSATTGAVASVACTAC